MSLLTQIKQLFERRFTLRDRGATELFGPPPVAAGVRVTPETALTYSAVWNAVWIYSQTVAMLPLHLYRVRADGGKTRAQEDPLYRVLHDAPNDLIDAYRWREMVMVHLLLWGNVYAEIERNNGHVSALWPITPWRVTPQLNGSSMWYEVVLPDGSVVRLPRERMFHIAGLGFDGLMGKSVISMARESLGLGMAAERFGARLFGSGATVAGVLMHPGELGDEAREGLRREWERMYTGLSNAHRVAVLEEGMKFERIGLSPEDSQFLQTRQHQVEEVARWFNLPPHMLKDLRRATFSNIEHLSLEFVKYSLLPWLRRIEVAIRHQLLRGEDQRDLFAEFVVEGLLRGDTESRYRAYATARQWGWLSANDIRRLENMDPIDGGDVYLVPLNMQSATMLAPAAGGGEEEQDNQNTGPEYRSIAGRQRLRDSFRPVIRDAAVRIVTREVNEVRKAVRRIWTQRDAAEWERFLEQYYGDFGKVVRRALLPPLRSLAEAVHGEALEEVGVEQELGAEYEQFVNDYAEATADRWVRSSAGQLRAVARDAEAAGEDVLVALDQRLGEWEETRADKAGRREAVRASEAFAKAAWVAAGVLTLRWMAGGEKPCPFCQDMNGRTVGSRQPFVPSGSELKVPGANPMSIFTSVGHPPLHDGCQCTLVPVVGLRTLPDAGSWRETVAQILEQARSDDNAFVE